MKSRSNDLGRSLIRAQKQRRNCNRELKSLIDENHVAELLHMVDLADEETITERHDNEEVKMMYGNIVLLEEGQKEIEDLDQAVLSLPWRPIWNKEMTKEILETLEKKKFYEWRKKLAKYERDPHIIMTPYEKNLDIWRQLWRLVDTSDIIVQTVDARRPLLYFSYDLCDYARSIDSKKHSVMLINKSDLLTCTQRKHWMEYLHSKNVDVLFWSAKMAAEAVCSTSESDQGILTKSELLDYFQNKKLEFGLDHINVGFVGYPNVGKSCTINALIGEKKVSVSSTPGKTKHLQSLNIGSDLTVWDCPGMVFPSFVISRSDLVLAGILSINHTRDYIAPITLICTQFSKDHLLSKYRISIPVNPDIGPIPINALDFLKALAKSRGKFSNQGNANLHWAAVTVVNEYTSGTLLYCHQPPGLLQDQYAVVPEIIEMPSQTLPVDCVPVLTDWDKTFFGEHRDPKMVIKGRKAVTSRGVPDNPNKPWRVKKMNRKEKLRRLHRDLDVHD